MYVISGIATPPSQSEMKGNTITKDKKWSQQYPQIFHNGLGFAIVETSCTAVTTVDGCFRDKLREIHFKFEERSAYIKFLSKKCRQFKDYKYCILINSNLKD